MRFACLRSSHLRRSKGVVFSRTSASSKRELNGQDSVGSDSLYLDLVYLDFCFLADDAMVELERRINEVPTPLP